MTTAPPELRDARSLAIEHMHIPQDSVGIVGGPSHIAAGVSYHLGDDHLKMARRPYSVYESSRDRDPDQYAAAIDYGMFSRVVNGKTINLRHFSRWLVAECRAGAAHTRNIREVIHSPDGENVYRWDRLNIRSSGDDSHLTHTHVSYFRNSRGAGAADTIREYLYHVGILDRPNSTNDEGEDDMPIMQMIPLPTRYAYRSTGAGSAEIIDQSAEISLPVEPAGGGSVWAGKRLYLSATGDNHIDGREPEIIRLAVHDGAGWAVTFHEVKPGPRVPLGSFVAKADSAFNVSVGRVRRASVESTPETDIPALGVCVTIA